VLFLSHHPRRGGAAPDPEDHILTYHATAATRTAAPEMPAASATPSGTGHATGQGEILDAVLASLEQDKAEDIVTIPLAGKSEMADHMVICSGRSSRQVTSIAEKLKDRLKQDHRVACKAEGLDTGDWVLIDAGDVIVHIFRPEVREFYQLEKMWLAPGTSGSSAS
jgi:ribosome-associated protein